VLACALQEESSSAWKPDGRAAVGTDNQGNSGFWCARDFDANGTAFLDWADEF